MKLKIFTLLLLCFYCSLNALNHSVSFIIPCYNCATTVEESIESIYQQNLKVPFEVICTDDGSTDATYTILKHCQSKFPNLMVYAHDHNKGGGAARNTCVKHARGDLIFCLDSDNVLCPDSVNQLIDLIDTTGCDVAAFAYAYTFVAQRRFIKALCFCVPGNTYDLRQWVKHPRNNPGCSGNYLFTRASYDRAGGYPEDIGAADTFGFGVAQLATGSIMRTIPNSFYWHRLSDTSYWVREEAKNKNSLNYCKILKKYSALFSSETQEILCQKNPQEIWALFENGYFTLASEIP